MNFSRACTHFQAVQLVLQHDFDFEESLLLLFQLLQAAVHVSSSSQTITQHSDKAETKSKVF